MKEPDFPGTYKILHVAQPSLQWNAPKDGCCVREDIALDSPELLNLDAGSMVNVEEVVLDYFDESTLAHRKRGRLKQLGRVRELETSRHPAGWISLVDADTSYRFAERAKTQEHFGKWAPQMNYILIYNSPRHVLGNVLSIY